MVSAQRGQEHPGIGASGLLTTQPETVAGAPVNGPEEDAPSIASGNRHEGWRADPRPSGPPGRQQAPQGPVREQQRSARRELAQAAADRPFFRARGGSRSEKT
jgi:hypothetical protein